MELKKSLETMEQLYCYGEAAPNDELAFLPKNQLVYEKDDLWIVTRSWINFGYQFQKRKEFIKSLFCFSPDYQQYLLQNLMVTALKMRQARNKKGLEEVVNHLPVFAGKALEIIIDTFGEEAKDFPVKLLEDRVVNIRDQFKEWDLLLFNGYPEYQRVLFYLDHVQRYQVIAESPDPILGATIDEMWTAGRKISTLIDIPILKNKPQVVLAPFCNDESITDHNLAEALNYPWQLLVLLLGIIREQYEAEGEKAISFLPVNGEIQVHITTLKGKQLLYGSLDDFADYFCRNLEFILFPDRTPPTEMALKQLYEKDVFRLWDGEYRLSKDLEDVLYTTRLGIPFITKSKQLTQKIKRFIDELRGD